MYMSKITRVTVDEDIVTKLNNQRIKQEDAFTEILPKYFPEPAARTAFEVSKLIGPTGTRFEIEAIAAAE